MANTKLSHSATVFAVSDMERSLTFYNQGLGFEIEFTWMDPPEYAVLKRDNVNLHLSLTDDPINPPKHRSLYIFPYNVDAVYSEFKNKNLTGLSEIGDRDYDMRDFDVRDPDGYIVCFGLAND